MKKRIGTLKGKPIVEGGGSNIIKKNEISINDIGSSSDSGDGNDDDGMLYFGIPWEFFTNIMGIENKVVNYSSNNIEVNFPIVSGTPDNYFFLQSKINSNLDYIINNNIIKASIILEHFKKYKPISKEEFYRTEYTVEEAKKIEQEYKDYTSQFAPSEP